MATNEIKCPPLVANCLFQTGTKATFPLRVSSLLIHPILQNAYICASFVQLWVTQALPMTAMSENISSSSQSQPQPQPLVANPSPGVSFNVRPFPPKNLVGVPVDFIVTSLNKFAPHYWAKPQSADCTISKL